MLPVNGVTMLERVVSHLGAHGVTEAVLALGYLPEVFKEAYPDDSIAGVQLHYAVEPEPLDTGGAICFAARSVGIDDTFIAVNGDVITDLDVGDLVDRHRAFGGEGTVHLTPVDDPSRYGVVQIDHDGRVVAFIEKPPAHEAPSNWINAGTYVFEPSVIDRVPAGDKVSIERTVFPAMVADRTLFAVQDAGYWVDAGTPESYLKVALDLVNGVRAAEPAIADDATIAGDAQIIGSIIGPGAIIEPGAVVERSMLHPRVRIGEGARVVDSIVGSGACIGARARLTELTVVGESVEIGANSTHARSKIPG